MTEQQIHAAFMAWLKKQGLFYVHSTFGKKATMTKNAPDFVIVHCGKALMVECKTAKGKLTAGQKEAFAELQEQSGTCVKIARSVPECVEAVETWLGVRWDAGGPTAAYVLHDWAGLKRAVAVAGDKPVKQPKPKKQPDLPVNGKNGLFRIGNWQGDNYVFAPAQDGEYCMIRKASAADLINYPKL